MEENINVTEESENSDDTVVSEEVYPGAENDEAVQTVSGGDSIAPVDYEEMYTAVYNAVTDAIEEQTVTEGEGINQKALEYFEGVLCNQILPVDYVIYVGAPYYENEAVFYDYCMAYGDLTLSGEHFTGEGDIITVRTSGSRSVTVAEDQAISLTASPYYSRSNLGSYSGVFQYDYTGLCLLLVIILGGVIWFMRKLFGFDF